MNLFFKNISFSVEVHLSVRLGKNYFEEIKKILEKEFLGKEYDGKIIFGILSLSLNEQRETPLEGFACIQRGTAKLGAYTLNTIKELQPFKLTEFDKAHLFRCYNPIFNNQVVPLKNLSKNELKPISDTSAGIPGKEEYSVGDIFFAAIKYTSKNKIKKTTISKFC